MVAAVLCRLKPNKSPAGDGLHLRVLVELKNEMATPLMMIFTRSLHDGQLPPSWKEANVTPIYKKGKRHIPGNYRPVSLTSVAGKCMERLIRDAIMTHMTEIDLLSPKQHGFIQGRSCVTQLLAVLDSWTLALDEGGNIDTIYLDFAKAFDTVPHQRLLMKLRCMFIHGRPSGSNGTTDIYNQTTCIRMLHKIVSLLENTVNTVNTVIRGASSTSVSRPARSHAD